MKKIIAHLMLIMFILGLSTTAFAAKKRLVFAGGPSGGTFEVVASAVQTYKPIKNLKDYSVKTQASGGSTENLRIVNSNRAQFGVVYSGEIWHGRHGKLKNDTKKYENVLAMGFLYGAPAQLIVRKGSGIKSVKDLTGKKVGVGNAGSGAFATAEKFFTHVGMWDKMERNAMGYNDAAGSFGNNQLDAFWLFTAFPSSAVIMAAQTNDIELINLGRDAEESGFFKAFPYYGKLIIPAKTYKGVDTATPSFQDSAIWVASSKTPAKAVYEILKIIYSADGLKHMVQAKKTFKEMSIDNGITGIVTPFHPGAEKFWKEKGKL